MKTNERKRKMLLVLPLLVIPFLSIAFWAMGGGEGKDQKQAIESGLNLSLPDSKLRDDKLLDKLGFYDKADKDSLKLAEEIHNDPYYKEKDTIPVSAPNELELMAQNTASKYNQQLNLSPFDKQESSPEQKLMQKLKLLQDELNKGNSTDQEEIKYTPTNSDADRLQTMMNQMNENKGDDTDMKEMSTVMDKILDIQYPERVKERMKEKSKIESRNAFKVTTTADSDTAVDGFYGLDNETLAQHSNAIEAVVNENQSLVNGAVIKLRLTDDIFINSSKITAGNFINGIVSLEGERLNVEINSIRSGKDLFTVKMEVYDMDGLPGIYISGAITRDVAKESADNGLQLMGMGSLDPSLKAQATAAGIGTVMNLLSRKVKVVRVTVKAGYKILLKNKNLP